MTDVFRSFREVVVDDLGPAVIGDPPGAAGATPVELRNGGLLVMDRIQPESLVSLDLSDDDGLEFVLELFPASSANDIMRQLGRPVDDRPEKANRRAGSPSLRFLRGSTSATRSLAGLAAALDRLDDPDAAEGTRAAAVLDLLVSSRAAPVALIAHVVLERRSDHLAALVGEGADDLVDAARTDRNLLDRMVSALRGDHGAVAAPWAEQLLRRLQSIAPSEPTRAKREPAAVRPASMTTEGRRTIHDPSGLTVTLGPADLGRWVVVRRRAGLDMVALAPVIADQVGYRAQLLLPPEDVVESGDVTARLQRVEFEFIDAPAFVGTAPQQIAEAIRAGRRAVEHERLGRAREATKAWLLCAGLWRSAGDEERAAQADRLSHEGAKHLRGAARISGSMASRSPAAEP